MTTQSVRTVPYSVLIVGSGAREHALVWALARSPSVGRIWAAPGNPGIATMAQTVSLPVTDVEAIADWAEAHKIGLVVVGPEAPLSLGLADRLGARGIPVFGPSRAAAELEWSKAFAKDFMCRHGIPTAPYGVFTEIETAVDFIRTDGGPLVVKADGLAAGKGVLICETPAEAEDAVRSVLVDRAFQVAGDRVVIEQFLEGEELSVIAVVDGERFAVLPPARDYKRLRDGNLGPNTGGMGSYAPVSDLDPDVMARVRKTVLEPAVAGLRAEGRPYRGALYAGLMLTSEGPMALEFNCRDGSRPRAPRRILTLPCVSSWRRRDTRSDRAPVTQSTASKTRSSSGRSSSMVEPVSAIDGSSLAVAEFSRWSGRAPIWPRQRHVPTRRLT
ncbi:MAG: phosphoribosylamine--glycine ligase [Thermomicrobiales bacterium]|nr:phosphoribosylamine--glycine ligase [Thermomicrobiales bacterium]